MIFKIFINIESIELFGIEACEEHTDNKQQIQRLHLRIFFLHSLVDVIIIEPEIFNRMGCAEVVIVVIYYLLHLIGCDFRISKALVHAGSFIVLTAVCRVCEYRTDFDVGFQFLEDIIVTQ